MVRHPLKRIVSAYLERMASVDATQAYPSINQAVRSEPMMIDSSRYWEVFDYYRHHFREDRIKIVWFEDFINDTDSVFRDVCRFLNIDDGLSIVPAKRQLNSRAQVLESVKQVHHGSLPEMDADWDTETRKWVLDQIMEDNRQLLRYFGKPEDYWNAISTSPDK